MTQSDLIRVYVCPDPECGNYYGSTSMGKLEDEWNINWKPDSEDHGKQTFKRSRCPDCGKDRQRRYAKLIPQDEINAAIQARNRQNS